MPGIPAPSAKKATDEQKQMAVDKLDAWRREGVDHAAALENAAIAGWQGLFKPDTAPEAGRRRWWPSASQHPQACRCSRSHLRRSLGMKNIATFADHAMRESAGLSRHSRGGRRGFAAGRQPRDPQAVHAAARLGYGSLFTSKFATGQMAGKHDKGAISAMKVWDAKLSRFPATVVEQAASRLAAEHADFPPNLPQFEQMCDAAMPRQTYAQQQGLPALPAPVATQPVKVNLQERNDGKDWARRIVARMEGGGQRLVLLRQVGPRRVGPGGEGLMLHCIKNGQIGPRVLPSQLGGG